MSEPTIYEVAKEVESLRRPYLVQSTDVTAYRKLLGKRYLMHVQSWGFQHRKQPPCCEQERQIV